MVTNYERDEIMTTKDIIKSRRKELNLSQKQVAEYVGVSEATVSRWESGNIANMGRDKIALLSKLLRISPSVITGYAEESVFNIKGISPLPKTYKKPRLGTIACGEPILAQENIEGYDDIPEDIQCDFTLQCKGDSMINARINDGDIVYIRQQSTVENGEIAAVLIDDEATLKRVYVYDDKVILQPENPKYSPFVYLKEEMNHIRILGKAVGFTSRI